METVSVIMLWLHYLATVMWIGGMAFNIFVLRPSMMVLEPDQRLVIGYKVLRRFIIFAWLSIITLILTGISIATSPYGTVLLGKHLVTSVMVLIVAWISFVLSSRLAPFAPKPETIVLLVKTNLSLGILVLLLTALLRYRAT